MDWRDAGILGYDWQMTIVSRKLSAIEIAEGALLADIAVILQLFALYLPVFDVVARLIIPIVLAVLVLRRSLYVGVISACVAGFVVAMLSGIAALIPMLLSCGTGLFLGLTMRRRLPHIPLIILGVAGGTLTVCALLLLFTLLAGLPLATIARQLERSYQAAMAVAGAGAGWAGLGDWWRQTALPSLDSLAQAALAYWWALFPAAVAAFLCPVVIGTYFSTNAAVRLLGYDVRPFPGGRLERLLVGVARRLVRLGRSIASIEKRA
ncbi:MAG TPA: DUF2232 domain-containing protein [Roseiflexaceae bacterium]